MSLDTEDMNGIIIIASMNPAGSMPIPKGAPEKSGRPPRYSMRNGSTLSARNGAKTKSPHMP